MKLYYCFLKVIMSHVGCGVDVFNIMQTKLPVFDIFCFFIYLLWVLHRFQHCTGHMTMGSFMGKGNQYILLVRVLYCKLQTISK